MEKKRDITIDIMKGILMLLVVSCHAQGPGHRLIYLFHMAVFFMISGYLWGDRKDVKIVPYIKRKAITLYIPYVVCNVAYVAWFLLMPTMFEREMCNRTVTGVAYEIVKIILLQGRSTMSNPSWFLAVMFIISIAYAVVVNIIGKVTKNDRIRLGIVTVTAIAALVLGYLFYLNDFNRFQVGTICSSYAAFHMGNIIWKTLKHGRIKAGSRSMGIATIFAGGGLLLLYKFTEIELRLIDNIIINPVIYCLGMIFGWIVLRCVSAIFAKVALLRNPLSYLGRNSMVVLCAHFAAFKMIAFLQCLWLGLPISEVSAFPVVRVMGMWWCAYTLAGISLPLLTRHLLCTIRERIIDKKNAG